MRMPHLILIGLVLMLSTAAARSAEPGPVTFKGRVVDASDRPIGGAEVVILGACTDPFIGAQINMITRAEADERGHYEVTSESAGDYERILVAARHEGFAIGSWNGALSELPGVLALKLGSEQSIAGTVVDESQQPIAGAIVKAMLRWNTDGRVNSVIGHEALPELMVKTDEAGRFEINAVPVGAGAILAVRAEGYATQLFPQLGLQGVPAGTDDARIVLMNGVTINGQVASGADGAKLEGLTVVAQFNEKPYLADCRAVTDAEGRFSLSGLPMGEVNLIVAPGEVDLSQGVDETKLPLAGQQTVQVADSETATQDVTFALQRASVLETTVVNRFTQEPVGEATFHYVNRDNNHASMVQTNDKGLGRVLVMPGPYMVYAEHPEYNRNGARRIVTVGEGQTMQVPVGLVQAQMLSGTVKDAQGEPVAGVKVEVLPANRIEHVLTDQEGKFKMKWEPADWGRDMTSLLVLRDESAGLALAVPIDDTTKPFDVTLEQGTTFVGRVLSEGGEPLPAATISISIQSDNWGSGLSDQRGIRTDADGRFKITGMPTQVGYSISASADGYGQHAWRFDNVDPTETVLEDAKLLKADQELTGTVVDSKGDPVASAWVQVYGDNQAQKRVETDAEGKFKLDGLCKGYANLYVNTQGSPHMYGQYYAKVGQDQVKVVISERGTNSEPPTEVVPVPIKDKAMPDLGTAGLESAPTGKPVLVLFMDANQRSSRHALDELIKKMGASSSAHVVVVQVGEVDDALLEAQGIKLPMARVEDKAEDVCVQWGVPALPWYVLADASGKVVHSGTTLTPAR